MPSGDPRKAANAAPWGYWMGHNIANSVGAVQINGVAPPAGFRLIITAISVELTGAACEVAVWMGGTQRMSFLMAAGTPSRLLLNSSCLLVADEATAVAIIIAADATRTRTMALMSGLIVPV